MIDFLNQFVTIAQEALTSLVDAIASALQGGAAAE